MSEPEALQMRARFERLRRRYARRDARMAQVAAVREGRISEVAPDLFPTAGPWQEPIVANLIDIAARDVAEMVAPLPAVNCSSPSMDSERARAKATKRTRIAQGYVAHASLQRQMYTAADRYVTFGFLPIRVDVDYDGKMPFIRCLDPRGSYPDRDRFGRLRRFYQRVSVPAEDLADTFPSARAAIERASRSDRDGTLEVVLLHDADADTVWCNVGEPFLLASVPNPLGRVLVTVVDRPGAGDVPRGQFDDVIFVQLAKTRFAMLALQAAHESVNAPLVVPSDVPQIPHGPGATIRTSNPQGVGRVRLDVPAAAFAEQAALDREMQLGARFPEVRTGNMDSSVVTGKGVQALMGGYDSQVRGHQAMWADALTEVVGNCFAVDEEVFGAAEKTLRGTTNGTPYEIRYTPSRDIASDHTVDVRYGLMAGLDPNRWLVFGLQARAEKLFSRDFMRREMPVDLDAEEEARKVDLEDLEEAAKLAIMGYAQAIPAIATAGQDATAPVQALAQVIDMRRKGVPISDAVAAVFAPQAPPQVQPGEVAPGAGPEALAGAAQGQAQAAGGEGLPRGIMPSGRLQGVQRPGEKPGGRPDLAMALASLDSRGQANLQYGISRMRAI
ncbi:MAG TPA: hypothetical protein VF104_10995 [Burkholderiales bacterium]